MTRLLQPAPEVSVELGADGAPARLTGGLAGGRDLPGAARGGAGPLLDGPLRGPLEPQGRWLIEQDWWERPVAREYWKAVLNGRLLVEIFHDLLLDAWFLERIYD